MAQGWHVVGQRQMEELGPGGRFVQVMRVSAVTDDGVEFAEDIPLSRYSPEFAAEVLQHRADAIAAVHAL